MNEEFLEKMTLLKAIKTRLETFQIELPLVVTELRVLYLGTYSDQSEFWLDENNPMQRLHAYEQQQWLVVDESIVITQAEYFIFKSGMKF